MYPQRIFVACVDLGRHRNYGSKPALPISRIEFLQDSNDNLSHIVSSYANVKFFQKCKCSAIRWEV